MFKKAKIFVRLIFITILVFLIVVSSCSCDNSIGNAITLNEDWQKLFKTADCLYTGPVFSDGFVCFGNTGIFAENTLYIAKIIDGKLEKKKIADDRSEKVRDTGNLSLHIQCCNGQIYYLKEDYASDFSKLYKYDPEVEETNLVLEEKVSFDWCISNDYLIFLQVNGYSDTLCYRKLNSSNKTEICFSVDSFAVLDNRVRYVTSKNNDYFVYEFDLETQKQLQLATFTLKESASFAYGLETIVAYNYDDPTTLAVYSLNDNTLNEYKIPGEICFLNCSQNYAFFAVEDAGSNVKIYRMRLNDGETEFIFEKGEISDIIVVNDEVVYVITFSGMLFWAKECVYRASSDGSFEEVLRYSPF